MLGPDLLLKEEKAHDQCEAPQIRSFVDNLAPASRVGLVLFDLGANLEEFLVV